MTIKESLGQFGDKMSVGAQMMVVVLEAFVERCVSLVLGHPFDFPGSMYPRQMYFIGCS